MLSASKRETMQSEYEDPGRKIPHSAVILVGPTAVGKTEISLELAERLNAEIVSVDSRLFYRGMDIGTAKPSLQDRSRIPHHLIDIAEPDETVGLATFQRLADEAISGIFARQRLPLLVGGTGQYVSALAGAWVPPSVAPNRRLRAELQRLCDERGALWLHERLQTLDHEAAALIDARNSRRTARALEVVLLSGRRFSEQRARGSRSFQTILVGLRRPRAELYSRVDERIENMWKAGLLEEARHLLQAGFDESVPAMSAIGYSQCLMVIRGALTVEDAKADMRRATRSFVRRQSNWFKNSDPQLQWFEAGEPDVVSLIEDSVRRVLREIRPNVDSGPTA